MHRITVQSDSKKWGDRYFVYLLFQENEKQMQDPFSRDRVRENIPKGFGHRVKEEILRCGI